MIAKMSQDAFRLCSPHQLCFGAALLTVAQGKAAIETCCHITHHGKTDGPKIKITWGLKEEVTQSLVKGAQLWEEKKIRQTSEHQSLCHTQPHQSPQSC